MTVIIFARAADGCVVASDGRRTRANPKDPDGPNTIIKDDVNKIPVYRPLSQGKHQDAGVIIATSGRGEVDGVNVHALIAEVMPDLLGSPQQLFDTAKALTVGRGALAALQERVYRWNLSRSCSCANPCPDFDPEDFPEVAGPSHAEFHDPEGRNDWCRVSAFWEEPINMLIQPFGTADAFDQTLHGTLSRTGQVTDLPVAERASIYGSPGPESYVRMRAAEMAESPLLGVEDVAHEVQHLLATAYWEAAKFSSDIGGQFPTLATPSVGGEGRIALLVANGQSPVVVTERSVSHDEIESWPVWSSGSLGPRPVD